MPAGRSHHKIKKEQQAMPEYTHIVHPFAPLYDSQSKILILGSLPSVKSREQRFFYGHPQNRYWRLMAAIFNETVPQTIEEKKALALNHHIAMWMLYTAALSSVRGTQALKTSFPPICRRLYEIAISGRFSATARPQAWYTINIRSLCSESVRRFCHQQVLQTPHGALKDCLRLGNRKSSVH